MDLPALGQGQPTGQGIQPPTVFRTSHGAEEADPNPTTTSPARWAPKSSSLWPPRPGHWGSPTWARR